MKKSSLNHNFSFLPSVFRTPTYNYVVQKYLWRKILSWKNSFSNFYFLCVTSLLCTPIDESYQNNRIFWGELTSRKKYFLQDIIFLFYHRSCLFTDNYIVQKSCSSKKFSEKLVIPKEKHFKYFYNSSVPHW